MSNNIPTRWYSRDPLKILIERENAVEKHVKGCNGCHHLNLATSGEQIHSSCNRGMTVGSKCTKFKETE